MNTEGYVSEDFISTETAKLLLEKGCPDFGYSCIYDAEGNKLQTQAIIMKWLRKKGIIIVIQPEYFNAGSKCSAWGVDIWADDNYEKLQDNFPSYEQACEVAIKYCLENLM